MTTLGCAAVVFDVDGTLADTEPLAYRAWTGVIAPYGYLPTPADLAVTRGRGYADVHAYFARAVPALLLAERLWPAFAASMLDLIAGTMRPFPDALLLLRQVRARGVPVALASSSPRERLDATIRALGIADLLTATAAGDEVTDAKPAPDVFLSAAHRLGVPPAHCIAIEDSDPGVAAARAAGMRVMAVRREGASRLECHTVDELTLDALLAFDAQLEVVR